VYFALNGVTRPGQAKGTVNPLRHTLGRRWGHVVDIAGGDVIGRA
jgi:hypothetical protein